MSAHAQSPAYVLPLSADAPEALDELRRACAAFVRATPRLTPANLLHSALRRRPRGCRLVALGDTAEALADALTREDAGAGMVHGSVDPHATPRRTAWLVGGEGASPAGLGPTLAVYSLSLRDLLGRRNDELRETWDVDLRAQLVGDEEPEALAHAAVELGLLKLWSGCGARPELVVATRTGEPVAFAAIGALDPADALHLVAARLRAPAAVDAERAAAVQEAFAAVAANLDWRPSAVGLLRADDGALIPAGELPSPERLSMRSRGAEAAPPLADTAFTHVLDFGADAATAALGARIAPQATHVTALAAEPDPLAALLRPLTAAWCEGAELDLGALLPASGGVAVALPSAPLATRRIWSDAPGTAPTLPPPAPAAPALPAEETGLGAIVAAIRGFAARELGTELDGVPDTATFFDMGADSLLMINMLRDVEESFGVKVAMRELFEEADSPVALAQLVASRRSDAPPPPAAAPAPPAAPPDPPPTPAPIAAHGPHVVVASGGGMGAARTTGAQRAHLEHLIVSLGERTRRSKQLAARFRTPLADSRASVGFRSYTKELLYPLVARSASGARIEDVDGNEYVDITMGFGILLFGHDPAFVRDAVAEHLAAGLRLGPRSEDTGVAAELLCELTGAERAAFATSGTEANSAAIRLARAATGRDRIALFKGAYHGHFDSMLARAAGSAGRRTTVPVSAGIPHSAVSDVLVLDYDESGLEAVARHGDELAAVLVEPVQSRHPAHQPRELLTRLRALTEHHGIVLVFDEMLTGFRPHLRGAQGWFGVDADLATYGKLLGGGFPIGAIAGRRALMDRIDGGEWRYGDDSQPASETVFFGGTYVQHPVAMAAARATLGYLREQGPQLQERLNGLTDRLAERLNRVFAEQSYPLRMAHFGSQFRLVLERDLDLLFPHLLARGVYVWEWRNFFLSTAHTEADVDHVAEAAESSLAELREAGWVPGAPPRASATPAVRSPSEAARAPRFSLYYFGSYPRETPPEERYELLFESARFADEAGFHALWVPERHFHAFGGIFPNPSVLAAALARETRRIRLHAGSVVLPLHNPIRVAEEWSVVDNLSGGRVGLGVASGWHANDFALAPNAYGRHKQAMYEGLQIVKALWRGDAVETASGTGETISVRLHPPPLQPHPPLYTAVVGSPDSYRLAAEHDLGIVTNLMTQDVDQLAERVAAYRAARAAAGLDPAAGSVVVLLHTYLAASEEQARADAFRPFCDYLRSSLALFGQATNSLGMNVELEHMSEEDLDYVLERAFTSYCDTRALIGTVDSCTPIAERVLAAGADELACFVDFGVSLPQLRGSLPRMVELRDRVVRQAPGRTPASAARDERITRARGGDALLTLFCLPHAGGSAASLYHGWDAALDGVARVVPLELPGRGRRAGEPPYADLDAVLADCAKRIAAEIDGAGFALFGHSIGGLLAYELDATLRRDGARAPAALVLAATIPPNRAERHAQIHELRDEELLAAVAHLGGLPQAIVDHPEARAFHAAALRADYRLYEHHRLSDPPHRVAVPLLVLLGGDDPLAAPDDSARWRALAAAGLTTRVVPSGSHFFPHAQRDQTLAAVGGFLAGVREH